MGIMFSFILRSLRERKFRTFLILFAISLSTALFFASNALNLTLQKMFMQVMRKYYGESSILVESTRKSPWNMSLVGARRHLGALDWVIGCVDGNAKFKPDRVQSIDINMRGFQLADLFVFSQVTLMEQRDLEPFVGSKIIVSKPAADKYGWKLGDGVIAEMDEVKRRYTVVGIALPTGVFQPGFDRSETWVVPRDYLAGLYGIRGRVTAVFAHAADPRSIPDLIATLAKEYPRYQVREPVEKAEQERFMDQIKTPLLLMSVLVLLMSAFIIYSSFRVITVERQPVIGTFRSIGATRRTTDLVLMTETTLYGVVGGVLGCLLGIGILYVMTDLMAYNAWAGFKMKTEIHFTFLHLASGFLLAMVLSLAGSIVPIVKMSRVPVKDVILGRVEARRHRTAPRLAAGLAAAALSVVLPMVAPRTAAFPVTAACLFTAVGAMIALVPYLTSLLIRVLQGPYQLLFGNAGVLAAKNLRDNRSILNNISLLALSISSLILIFTIAFSALQQTISFWSDARFRLQAWAWRADRTTELVIRSVPGVESTTYAYSAYGVRVEGNAKPINLVQGVDTRAFPDFWDLKIPRGLFLALDDGRTLLLTNILRDQLGARIGDVLTLELAKGKKKYTVIGFFPSLNYNGSYAIASQKFLRHDVDSQFYDSLFIKTSAPPSEVETSLRKKLARRYPWISTVDRMLKNNLESNQQMFTLLEGFAAMTLVMGAFGVLNNFIVSFVERRRHFAIFRSVGMSKAQTVRMLLTEALTGGLVGGIVGSAGAAVFLFIGTYLLKAMDMYVKLLVSPAVFLSCVAASLAVSVAASVSPALKSGRLSVIDAIKYE